MVMALYATSDPQRSRSGGMTYREPHFFLFGPVQKKWDRICWMVCVQSMNEPDPKKAWHPPIFWGTRVVTDDENNNRVVLLLCFNTTEVVMWLPDTRARKWKQLFE